MSVRRARWIGPAATLTFVATVTPASAWHVALDGTGASDGAARAVARAPNGDVIVGGFVAEAGTGADFVVLRLAGDDGAEIWRVVLPGPTAGNLLSERDEALAVALDAEGDVIAAGRTSAPGIDDQFTVVKLAGATGVVRWRQDASDAAGLPIGITVEPGGDAYVASSKRGTVSQFGFVPLLTRRAADTGEALWTYEGPTGFGTVVALHPSGDPLFLVEEGFFYTPSTTVRRIDRAAGTEIWHTTLPGSPRVVHALSDGDLYATSTVPPNPPSFGSSTVALLSGETGIPVWSRSIAPVDAATILPDGSLAVLATASQLVGRFQVIEQKMLLVLARAGGATLDDHPLPSLGDGGLPFPRGHGASIVLDPPSGDLFLTYGPSRLFAARLAAGDLHEVWRHASADLVDVPGTFWPSAAAGLPDGTLVVAGSWRRSSGDARFHLAVITFAADDGATQACGDAAVDAGEGCDDGGIARGTCCPADCKAAQPDGTSCDDGNVCTLADRCVAGVCQAGSPLPCEPCGVCDPMSGCHGNPNPACRHGTTSDAAVLSFDRSRLGRTRFGWTLRSGPATTRDELGDPRGASGYGLCGFDAESRLVLRTVAPAGSSWRRTRRGFTYADDDSPEGVARLALRSGAGGRSRLRVTGTQAQSLLPALPVANPLRIELRRVDDPAVCWAADHATVRKNNDRRYLSTGN